MSETVTYASAGMVNLDTLDRDRPLIIENLLKAVQSRNPGVVLIGEPRFEVGQISPRFDDYWDDDAQEWVRDYPPNLSPYRLQIDVAQPQP